MNVIFIDTSSNERIKVGLKLGNKKCCIISSTNKSKAQAALPLIDRILKKHDLKIKDIDNIQVNTGPGSFTGLKVGVAIANALSFTLLKKINNKEIGDFEIPQY